MSFQRAFERRNHVGRFSPEAVAERAARLDVRTVHAGGGRQRVRPFMGMKPGADRWNWRLRPAPVGEDGLFRVTDSGAWVRRVKARKPVHAGR